jgi:hypothetical protein
MVNVMNYEEFVSDLTQAAQNRKARIEDSANLNTFDSTQPIQKLLKFLNSGALYRNQRVFMKIK